MNETEEIKQRLPIEQLIGHYLPLKKAGRIYKACCPFHNEKTPSFTVSPERNIFKCFGCGEGGDIFDFIMKIEGLTFPETVRLLAERAGVTLTEWKPPATSPGSPEVGRDRIFKLNDYLSKLWHALLLKHPKTGDARAYLDKRGLTTQTIQTFQIGYAPPGTGTLTALKQAGFTPKEIQAAGDPGKFQDRIIFPIQDLTGRVIGFTGRLMERPGKPSAQTGPKYWNTPETAVFSKSRAVYALHLAKQAIQKEDRALLVEGQMDVVALHQAGYHNTIASSGTALTSEQLRLIGRFSDNVCFAYDQDQAGQDATKRGLELVLSAELNPFVVTVPHGKDPADCLQTAPDRWKEAYQNQQPFMQWLIDLSFGKSPGHLSPLDKKEIAKELLPWLQRITNNLEKDDWLRIVAAKLQTAEANLRTALNKTNPAPISAQQAGDTAANSPATTSSASEENPIDSAVRLAELAAALILTHPENLPQVKEQLNVLTRVGSTRFLDKVVPSLLESQGLDDLADNLNKFNKKDISLRLEELLSDYQDNLTPQSALTEIMVILGRLRSSLKEKTKERLAQEISRAQLLGDQDKLKQLFSELKNLI